MCWSTMKNMADLQLFMSTYIQSDVIEESGGCCSPTDAALIGAGHLIMFLS